MRLLNWFFAFALVVLSGVALSGMAEAKDKKGGKSKKSVSTDISNGKKAKNVPKGQVERQKNGAKPIPPGQIKRYTRGTKLPRDLKYESLKDLSKWNLKPLKSGEEYIRVDKDILRIQKDTRTVVDAVGIVDDLLR